MKTKLTSLLLGIATPLMFSACNEKDKETSTSSGSVGLGTGVEGGVQLETELPKEKIEGSPAPKNIPNLLPRAKKFPEFKVPEGTVLLSKGKKVTSDDDYPILGEFSLVTDGDKEADEGCFVEFADGNYIQIDLEQSAPLYAIICWHYHAAKRVYHDVIVQVSDDPEFKPDNTTTLYNNDYDDSSGFGKGSNRPYVESRYGLVVDGKGTKARYVRLYSKGNTANEENHYIEVEVFGKPE